MNESKHQGIIGVVTTLLTTFLSALPEIDLLLKFLSGVVAIVVGICTARYYIDARKYLKNKKRGSDFDNQEL